MENNAAVSGDGANDVSMIQVADVGIGISGQEGMQVLTKKRNDNNTSNNRKYCQTEVFTEYYEATVC